MTAQRALEALRTLGRSYRPDPRQPAGLWAAQCPTCRFYCDAADRPLTIREAREGGDVSVRCRHDCPPESVELALRAALEPETGDRRLRRLELRLELLEFQRRAS